MTKKIIFIIRCFAVIVLTLLLFNSCNDNTDTGTGIGTIQGIVTHNSEVPTNYCNCKIAKNEDPDNIIMSKSVYNNQMITFDNLETNVVYYICCNHNGIYQTDEGGSGGYPIFRGGFFKYEDTCLLDESVMTQQWQLNLWSYVY